MEFSQSALFFDLPFQFVFSEFINIQSGPKKCIHNPIAEQVKSVYIILGHSVHVYTHFHHLLSVVLLVDFPEDYC
jgi:hypothetical protein